VLWHVGCFRLKFELKTPNTSQRVAPTMLRSFGRAICMPRHCCSYYKRWHHHLLLFRNVADLLWNCRNVYSPSDFCINWHYSGKGEEKVGSLQLLTQEITEITFKAATNDLLFFFVLTRRVVNLSNQGSDIFILMQMAVICDRDQFYWQDDLRKEFQLKVSPGIIVISQNQHFFWEDWGDKENKNDNPIFVKHFI